MINAGLEYGYICTRQASTFLHVQPHDPTTVYYYLSSPDDDVGESTEREADSKEPNLLHLTEVGQVLAFTLRAMSRQPHGSAWIKEAKRQLNTWNMDPNQVPSQIPETAPRTSRTHPTTDHERKSQEAVLLISVQKTRDQNAHKCNSDEIVKDSDEFDDDKDDTVDTPSRPSGVQRPSSRIAGTSPGNQSASKRTTT